MRPPLLAASFRTSLRPILASLGTNVRRYSSGEVPVPITRLTEEEQMMKDTG